MIAESVEIPKERTLSPMIPAIIALLGAVVSSIIIVLPLQVFLSYFVGGIPLLSDIPAPLTEEPFKVIGIMYLAFVYPGVLRNKRDGLWLGLCAAAGFVFVENLMYAMNYGGFNIIARTVISAPGHFLDCSFTGLGLVLLARRQFSRDPITLATVRKELLSKEVLTFFGLAMLFHFTFNFLMIGGVLGYGVNIAVLLAEFYVLYHLYYYLPDNMENVKIDSSLAFVRAAMKSKKPAAGKPQAPAPYQPAIAVPVRVRAATAPASNVPAAPAPAQATASAPVVLTSMPAPSPAPAHSHVYCTQCGAENRAGAQFCSKCGIKLGHR